MAGIAASSSFTGVKGVDVKEDIRSWQDNLNRGIIDVFILGSFLSRPSYGNALILEAEAALASHGHPLPQIAGIFMERGLISQITDEERAASRVTKPRRTAKDRKRCNYDITVRGLLPPCYRGLSLCGLGRVH